MHSSPWDPLGEALLDYHRGDISSKLIAISDLEDPEEVAVGQFFRRPDEFPSLEQTAMSLCKGRVLDIGAGAGCHALALQELGHSVCAIDIAPQAVEVMDGRGVEETSCSNIFGFRRHRAGRFDTLLMMMNGIGIVENLHGLTRFLKYSRKLILPEGRLLLDSLDLRETCSAIEIEAREASPVRSYYGEVLYQFHYEGEKGPEFWWLYVDPETLTNHAAKCGWLCESIYRQDDGHYLAHLALDR